MKAHPRGSLSGVLVLSLVAVVAAVLLGAGTAGSATSAPPSIVEDPSISGTATVGSTLKGHPGTWKGGPGLKYKYLWRRCNENGESCEDIAGATESSYVLTQSDLGSTIRLRVTATNSSGSKFETSAPTPVVVAANGTPANSKPPTISGTAAVGSVLSSTTGNWVGDQPITYTYQWQRCDTAGNACTGISGATQAQYTLVKKDANHTVRIRVTGKNSRGKSSAFSVQSDVVQDTGGGSGGGGSGGGGGNAVAVGSLKAGDRLIVDTVQFSPNPVTSRSEPIRVTIKVKDTNGKLVKGAFVFIRSTPILTSTPTDAQTDSNGTVVYTIQPRSDFPLKNGYNVQFFVKAYRQGDPSLAGISGTRLVQVATKSP